MAITTDSTQPGAGQLRTDSGNTDLKAAVRVPPRTSGTLTRDSGITSSSGERAAGRLRSVSSASLHESVTPDRLPAQSPDSIRRMAPAEFNTAMAHFYSV